VNPIARDRSLAMAMRRCRPRYMAGWLEDHVASISSLNSNFGLAGRNWLKWRPGGALRWKVETVGWEGQRVVCGKSTPLRL
jgi:hypothetical protein